MATTPYGPDTDRSEIPEQSGAAVLLELGELLCQLEMAQGRGSIQFGDAADLRERVRRKQDAVVGFLKGRPRAAMRKYVAFRTGGEVDPRACRLVGYLAARMVLNGMDAVGIMQAAQGISLTGSPADLLEGRRYIAAVGSHGIVECSGKAAGLWHPMVRLAGDVMIILLGGAKCIPVVNSEVLAEVAADRRRRLGHSMNKPRPRRRSTTRSGVAGFVDSIPVATPREICEGLESCGYVGQEAARRAVALAAYRHVERLRQIHLMGVPREELPPPANLLCMGPTGCGKSHLMKLMFDGALMIPTAVIDSTSYSETGYVGGEVGSIPTHLLLKADGNADKAQCGVIVLDEIDKLAEDGTGSRVSRHGVQRSLLKLLDSGTVEVPVDLNGYHWKRRMVSFRTHDLLWVACGAFSGLKTVRESTGGIGFSDEPCGRTGGRGATLSASAFEKYGLLPELVGRFHQWVRFDPLSKAQLKDILTRNAVGQRRRELKAHGIRLEVEDAAIDLIVGRAVERGTGARGIEAELAGALEEASFEAYSSNGKAKQITVSAGNGDLAWDVSFTRASKAARGGKELTMEDVADMAEGLSLDGC